MKRFIKNAFLVIVCLTVAMACQNSAGNTAAAKGAAADQTAAASATSGDGSFSASIDGQTISGKGTDELQLTNTAFHYPVQGSGDRYILSDLMSSKNGADFYSLRLYTPDKEGTFAVADARKNGYRCSIKLSFDLKSSDNFANYDADAVTVNIDKISSSRISGTFSGQFKLSDDTRSKPYKPTVNVTNGKFDIPFSTGNLRPE